MIKNILYSLLLHSTFAFLVYANFHHIINEKMDLKDGITVGIVDLQDITKPTKIVTKSETIINKPDKLITKKPTKSRIRNNPPIARPLLETKTNFKKTEEEKTEEVTKKIVEEKPIETKEEEEDITIEEVQNVVAESANNAEDLENLQLSAREKFNIQSQLKACYRRALANNPKSSFTAIVKVTILQDGTIDFDAENIIDANRYNDIQDTNYKNRMDSVVQALELCSPLRNMPSDKYEIWREFTIEFASE